MEYYYLFGRNSKVSSIVESTVKVIAGTQWDLMIGKSEFPYGLALRRISFPKGVMEISTDLSGIETLWLDYIPNEWAWPMMSERMAAIVQAHLTGEEGIDWIKAWVSGPGETRLYLIPRFSILFDIWDKEKTIYADKMDLIVNPWFSKDKVARLALFYTRPQFWEITGSLVVNESLMKALKKAKLSGVKFSPARSS